MTRKQRTPTHARDTDLREIVLVPLANHSKPAKIFREDFEALLAAGYSSAWTFNAADSAGTRRYVRCGVWARRGNLAIVARLILSSPKGRVVKHRDGDRLNLRRDNLFLAEGRAPGITMRDETADAAA
jgi:HNH endonuclease